MRKRLMPAWPIILLAALAVIFFVGGVALEIKAGDHGAKAIVNSDLSEAQMKDALSFQGERIKGIHQAAAAALDIAKICLGALVAAIAQSVGGRAQSSSLLADES